MKIIIISIIIGLIYSYQKVLYNKFWDKGLRISVEFDREIVETGQKAGLNMVVTNEKKLPLPTLHVKYAVDRSLEFDNNENAVISDMHHRNDVFSIMGYQRIKRNLEFTANKRGVYDIIDVSLIVRELFMTKSFAKKLDTGNSIYVLPEKKNVNKIEAFFINACGEIAVNRSMQRDDLMFRGIRDYQAYDSIRTINWKQTARCGRPLVNEYEFTKDCDTKIMLNLDTHNMIKPDPLLEESISLCSSVSLMLLKRRTAVALLSNACDMFTKESIDVKSGGDIKHQKTIDKALARIDGTFGKDYFLASLKKELEAASTNTTYVVISPYYKENLLEILDKYVKKGIKVLMVVPYYDLHKFEKTRAYQLGWEVKYDEV